MFKLKPALFAFPICVICFLIFLISVFAEESLTITTYYPSPYGSYRELRAQRIAIGDTYIDGSAYCWEGTCTTAINADADLVVEGNLGIGTTSPQSPAPNNQPGNLDANDVYLRSAGKWVSESGAPHGKQRFTSSNIFTVPAGVTTVWVSMSGGGGGGRGSGCTFGSNPTYATSIRCGGGGGADAVIAKQVSVLSGQKIIVTVGGGGHNAGGDGGTSSFGSFISTLGGKGAGSNGDGGGKGGSGGTDGEDGSAVGGGRGSIATGGDSIFGSGGKGYGLGAVGSAPGPYNGSGYGSGGGGGLSLFGGTGAPGFVLVEW